MNGTSSIVMLVVMIAIFYFLLIRPENKRKKAAEQMRNNLKKGDTVTTIGGIVGKVIAVSENTLVIETSEDRVRMELTKWAISTVNGQTELPKEKKEKDKKQENPGEVTSSQKDELPEDVVDEIPAPENDEPKD